jgi:hypothetical protein
VRSGRLPEIIRENSPLNQWLNASPHRISPRRWLTFVQEDNVRPATRNGISAKRRGGWSIVRLMMAAAKGLGRERMKLGDFVRLSELQNEVASDGSLHVVAGWVDG